MQSEPVITRLGEGLIALSPDLQVHDSMDLSELEAAEESLSAAIASFESSSGDPDMLDAVQACAWKVIQAWGQARCQLDPSLPETQVGLWELGECEAFWLNTGFVSSSLFSAKPEISQLVESLQAGQASCEGEYSAEYLQFGDLWARLYRSKLGSEESQKLKGKWQEELVKVDGLRTIVDRDSDKIEDFFARNRLDSKVGVIQKQIDQLMPHYARYTRMSRGAAQMDTEMRSAQMKLNEAVRRLRQAMDELIPQYGIRKENERLQNQYLNSMMDLISAEEILEAMRGNYAGDDADELSLEKCQEASESTLKTIQSAMRKLSNTPDFLPTPFCMTNPPRMSVDLIEEKVAEVLKACPRLKLAQEQGWYQLSPVALLPGAGNCFFDAESSIIYTSLFPTEARLTSIISSFGDCALALEPGIWKSYMKLSGKAKDEKSMLETFRRQFIAWVLQEHRARSKFDKETHKWFQHAFVDRITAP